MASLPSLLTVVLLASPPLIQTDLDDIAPPESWWERYELVITPIHRRDVRRAEAAVLGALDWYEPDLLAEVLDEVNLVGEFSKCGLPLTGTGWGRSVMIATRYHDEPQRPAQIVSSLHFQIASSLVNRYENLLDPRWNDLLPEDFQYSGNALRAIKSGHGSTRWEEPHLSEGFLHEYARASLRVDFASLAAWLFRNDERFWDLIDRHPLLREKTDMVIKLYHALDPRFTERFFRALPRGG